MALNHYYSLFFERSIQQLEYISGIWHFWVFELAALAQTFLLTDCKWKTGRNNFVSRIFLFAEFQKFPPEAWENKSSQNFVLKVYIVITSKVFADFRFESPISIDFQSEILALLRPKSAKTFHESLQILSPRKSARTFRMKVITIQNFVLKVRLVFQS